jgi:Fe-S oxidoreductase
MLSSPEKFIFIFLAFVSLTATAFGIRRLIHIIGAGQGKPDLLLAWKRLANVLARMVSFQPVFRFRFWPSLFHAFVGWGFGLYILVDLFDLVHAFAAGFVIPGMLGNIYRLLTDVSSVGVLIGMFFFVIRRYVVGPANLSARETTLIHPKARTGIRRDSAIVAGFIILHVGSRLLGESIALTVQTRADGWQPFASAITGWWSGTNLPVLVICQHIAFWLALGSILAFLPYFPYSKHVHLFFAPLNYLLKPARRSMGEMSYVNLDDPSIEQFGAAKLSDLGWEQLMDAYACIMCFRCQEVCPAYQTGKVLSPAALEVNKRYLLNSVDLSLPMDKLTDFAISPEAIWACTACGACVDICPVGDEPMRDILDIRRNLVLMENAFPKQLETVFRNLERTDNPWGVPAPERMKWAEGLDIPTIEQNPEPEILWWVGCAPATDVRAQKTARAFAKILDAARVDYAVLGQMEQCTGDSARRAGREDIFFGLAKGNVETLNAIAPKRIVTTCPHCLNTLKNEYPAFGGNYDVIHSTQLIGELTGSGKLAFQSSIENRQSMVFHDPCYLGRQNGVIKQPRELLKAAGIALAEMPHHGVKSFCCGAGGAQMWKEEEKGTARLSETRLAEAAATGAGTLMVGCPFCLTMLDDAAKAAGGDMKILDITELLAERLK